MIRKTIFLGQSKSNWDAPSITWIASQMTSANLSHFILRENYFTPVMRTEMIKLFRGHSQLFT